MSEEDTRDKGYTCKKCKKFNPYEPYVFAHWNECLIHTCECGARHSFYAGIVSYVRPKEEGSHDPNRQARRKRRSH